MSPRQALLGRIVADSTDRIGWLRARAQGVTATDVAKLSTPASVQAAVKAKFQGSRFGGSAFTEHGKVREPHIARWVLEQHGIHSSSQLFHAAGDRRHLATPDGVGFLHNGEPMLAEIKTTVKPFRTVPRPYLRQIWWQQYVLGAERTLFVWEEHRDFVPVHSEPQCRWIERDEKEVAKLVGLANQLLDGIAARLAIEVEPW
ncbi:YqaJ viral recombinase family protein [Saxibacter everestensis]|uniref:YqaJ viral recombinase family protein n=2 Tax=Saxibacter everestensis TaxID=2909229 RepID=A0ABY8QYX5_9MICO|nr:YqaJ viral recombinase family protein [Brevibacteriaceae bacterium ZFBP1038]